ncbi:MAG: hypothetical protein ACUVTX_01295 [Bacteroidales bacterium]
MPKIYISIILLIFSGCSVSRNKEDLVLEKVPEIVPDYTSVIIPPNIAPLNFVINEDGKRFFVTFCVDGGKPCVLTKRAKVIRIPVRKWKRLLKGSEGKTLKIDILAIDRSGKKIRYGTISNFIAEEPADSFLTYRVIFPGYESWRDLSIRQRALSSFSVRTIIKNTVTEENCVNCHAFNNGHTDDFLFHMRGSLGATYFYTGEKLEKRNLKTSEMKNGAVYPRWHPSGKYVAFSSNKIVQRFHVADNKKVEVSDLESSLVLYDREKNEIMPIPLEMDSVSMDTYPEWSPDGKTLYFCRAPQIGEIYDYKEIKYDLWKVEFNPETRQFGKEEIVFCASERGKSISFPRIAPDGRYMIVTMSDYGCFPIWHSEADIYSIDIKTGRAERLQLNSEFADSYHSISSNGRWILFASRRENGTITRPYIAYFDKDGKSGKAFPIPQKNPQNTMSYLKSFNLPEFSNTIITITPGKIRKASRLKAIPAKWNND